jgi:Putative Actinobacterial Holin-X, holin superfamily III
MRETVEPVDVSPDGDEPTEQGESPSITELVVQLGRDLSVLALCEAELQASRNMPEVRRAARDFAAALLVVVALATAFVFANVAAFEGLSTVVSGWVAALVLCAVWIVVGVSLLLVLLVRAGHATRWKWWRVFKAGPAEAAKDLEQARADAEQAVLDTLERLAPAITIEVATAAISNAGDMAEGMLDVSGDVLETSDEIVEAIAEDLPGGGVVNQMWDVVLMPGRYGLKVVTTVLKRDEPPD